MLKTSIKILEKNTVSSFIDTLKKLRVDTFKRYPYLQQTTEEYEQYYLQHFVETEHAAIIIASNNEIIISAITGIPLICDTGLFGKYKETFVNLFKQHHLNAYDYYYCGEVLFNFDFQRDEKITTELFKSQAAYAKQRGYRSICFLKVTEDSNNPLKPQDYQELEPIWDYGFQETAMKLNYSWPTIQSDGSVRDIEHELVFWVKTLT